MKKALVGLAHRSLNTEVTYLTCVDEINDNISGFKIFIEALKSKILRLQIEEQKFSHFIWTSTRPTEHFLYDKWKERIYPYNLFCGKSVSWNAFIDKFK